MREYLLVTFIVSQILKTPREYFYALQKKRRLQNLYDIEWNFRAQLVSFFFNKSIEKLKQFSNEKKNSQKIFTLFVSSFVS